MQPQPQGQAASGPSSGWSSLTGAPSGGWGNSDTWNQNLGTSGWGQPAENYWSPMQSHSSKHGGGWETTDNRSDTWPTFSSESASQIGDDEVAPSSATSQSDANSVVGMNGNASSSHGALNALTAMSSGANHGDMQSQSQLQSGGDPNRSNWQTSSAAASQSVGNSFRGWGGSGGNGPGQGPPPGPSANAGTSAWGNVQPTGEPMMDGTIDTSEWCMNDEKRAKVPTDWSEGLIDTTGWVAAPQQANKEFDADSGRVDTSSWGISSGGHRTGPPRNNSWTSGDGSANEWDAPPSAGRANGSKMAAMPQQQQQQQQPPNNYIIEFIKSMVTNAGFTRDEVESALKESNFDINLARNLMLNKKKASFPNSQSMHSEPLKPAPSLPNPAAHSSLQGVPSIPGGAVRPPMLATRPQPHAQNGPMGHFANSSSPSLPADKIEQLLRMAIQHQLIPQSVLADQKLPQDILKHILNMIQLQSRIEQLLTDNHHLSQQNRNNPQILQNNKMIAHLKEEIAQIHQYLKLYYQPPQTRAQPDMDMPGRSLSDAFAGLGLNPNGGLPTSRLGLWKSSSPDKETQSELVSSKAPGSQLHPSHSSPALQKLELGNSALSLKGKNSVDSGWSMGGSEVGKSESESHMDDSEALQLQHSMAPPSNFGGPPHSPSLPSGGYWPMRGSGGATGGGGGSLKSDLTGWNGASVPGLFGSGSAWGDPSGVGTNSYLFQHIDMLKNDPLN